jgi:hypothetical protein
MNLFELNARLAVKLGQSLETLYNLEYMEYSLLLNIVKKDIEEANEAIANDSSAISVNREPIRVNLPNNLSIK